MWPWWLERPSTKTVGRKRGWAQPSPTLTETAGSISLKPISPTTHPPFIATTATEPSKTLPILPAHKHTPNKQDRAPYPSHFHKSAEGPSTPQDNLLLHTA